MVYTPAELATMLGVTEKTKLRGWALRLVVAGELHDDSDGGRHHCCVINQSDRTQQRFGEDVDRGGAIEERGASNEQRAE